MRCYDYFFGNFSWETVSDGIRIETISATKTDEITLVDRSCKRKIIKTAMQNICHFSLMVSINIGMIALVDKAAAAARNIPTGVFLGICN